MDSTEQTTGSTIVSAGNGGDDPVFDGDTLVEEVSIDGMCGVY